MKLTENNEVSEALPKKEPLLWDTMDLDVVIDNILESFHEKHRKDLQTLIPLAQKVESVHADSADCPKGLASFFEMMFSELENHMQKEEQILFPMIKAGRGMMAQGPIHVMTNEHVSHEQNLDQLKSLAKNYKLPEGACSSWTKLYQVAEQLEKDIREHISIENDILFSKALKSDS